MALELKPATDKDITGWMADLDAADPQTRDGASWKLLDVGPAILPKLKEIANGPAPEPAQRAAALIAQIKAAPKRDAVRRLIAVRTLGELKKPEALPLVRQFIDSKEMFVADYARIAIAQIERKSAERTRAAGTDKDVWLLPAECRAVAHAEIRGGGPMDFAAAFKQFIIDEQDRQVAIDFIATRATAVAEAIGNVRIDALTVGVSGDVGEKAGYVVIIAAGQYDAAALNQFARRLKFVFKTVDGHDIFQPDVDTSAFLASDDRLVMVVKPKDQDAPLAEMMAAMESGEGKLKTAPEMVTLLGKTDVRQPIWAAMKVTDPYRNAPVLAALDEVTLVGRREAAGMRLSIHGTGPDSTKVIASADLALRDIAALAGEARHVAEVVPAMGTIADLLNQARVGADARGLSVSIIVRDPPTEVAPLQKDKLVPKN